MWWIGALRIEATGIGRGDVITREVFCDPAV